MTADKGAATVVDPPTQPDGAQHPALPAEPVRNTVNGPAGNVVQAGVIHGGVHVTLPATSPLPPNHQDLRDALAQVTVRAGDGTGVVVAPGVVLTLTAAEFAFVAAQDCQQWYALLADALDPRDMLVALYFPADTAGDGASQWITLRAVDAEPDHTRTRLLHVVHATLRPGYLGAPVLNWRTGAVCGVLTATDPAQPGRVRLAPASILERMVDDRGDQRGRGRMNIVWLNELTDDQVRAGGWRYPGQTLRQYLAAAQHQDRELPYGHLLSGAPALRDVYVPQLSRQRPDPDPAHRDRPPPPPERLAVEEILHHQAGGVVVGGPGAGKSSLVWHVVGESARRWLTKGMGEYVAIVVSADALNRFDPLSDQVAAAVTDQVRERVGADRLRALLAREPMPGVPWLILVDGLDEVAEWKRGDVGQVVVTHRRLQEYRFLVTTRPLSKLPTGLVDESHPSFEIERFDARAQQKFAARWFEHAHRFEKSKAAQCAQDLLTQVNPTLPGDLTGIPWITTMLCILYDAPPARVLPANQAELYAKFVSWLRRKRPVDQVIATLADRVRHRDTPGLQVVTYLGHHLDELLEWVAHRREQPTQARVGHPPSLLEAAGHWPQYQPDHEIIPDDEWTVLLGQALYASGLVIDRDGRMEFLHETIQEYLAARYLDRTRSLFMVRREFAPQPAWPWPDLQVKLFLAALWAPHMRRPLRRLLTRRYRDRNVGFVVALTHYGLDVDFVRPRVIHTLRKMVRDPAVMMLDWQQYLRWLWQVDTEAVLADIYWVLDSPDVAEARRFEAMRQLTDIDRAAATTRMTTFVQDPRNTDETRLRMARLAASLDDDHGTALLTILAGRAENADLRLDAAARVVERDRTRGMALLMAIRDDPHAEDSLRLRAALTHERWDPSSGHAGLLALLREQSLRAATRLQLARDLAARNAEAADDIYGILLREDALPTDDRIRGIQDFVAAFDRPPVWLAGVARDPTQDPQVRIAATWAHAASDPPAASIMLWDIAADPWGEPVLRLTATQLLDIVQHGGTLIRPVPVSETMVPDGGRLDVALAIHLIAGPAFSIPLLAEVARDRAEPAQARLAAAAAVADLDAATADQLYERIVADPDNSDSLRFDAADAVAHHYGRSAAEPLFLAIARDLTVRFDLRRRAIDRVAVKHRALLLDALSRANGVDTSKRLTAAVDAKRFHAPTGTRALADFALSPVRFTLRMEAIRAIPDTHRRLQLYATLSGPGFTATDRLTAAKAASELGSFVALERLTADRTLPRRIRNAAQDELSKRRTGSP